MEFTKSSGTGGVWIKKTNLQNGDLIKLTTEATEQPSQQGGVQIVTKAKVKRTNEEGNISINNPSKNALIDAFGTDSQNWVDKVLTTYLEQTRIAGKLGIALYLIPEGFEHKNDTNGYLVITRIGAETSEGIDELDAESIDGIPF